MQDPHLHWMRRVDRLGRLVCTIFRSPPRAEGSVSSPSRQRATAQAPRAPFPATKTKTETWRRQTEMAGRVDRIAKKQTLRRSQCFGARDFREWVGMGTSPISALGGSAPANFRRRPIPVPRLLAVRTFECPVVQITTSCLRLAIERRVHRPQRGSHELRVRSWHVRSHATSTTIFPRAVAFVMAS